MFNQPDQLSESEKLFWRLEFNEDRLSRYPARLNELGFVSREHVLDIGCGMGQWSYALASLNKQVTAVDKNLSRISVAKTLYKEKCSNLSFTTGTCESIPATDAQFDAVMIYGVLMFSDWRSTLREISRVSKPGSIIYLNYNHLGRYIYRLFNPTGSYLVAVRDILIMLLSTFMRRRSNVLINDYDFLKECKSNCLVVLHGPLPEGFITTLTSSNNQPLSYYPADFLGMRCVTEYLLVKR